jgi:hypothetical protein
MNMKKIKTNNKGSKQNIKMIFFQGSWLNDSQSPEIGVLTAKFLGCQEDWLQKVLR